MTDQHDANPVETLIEAVEAFQQPDNTDAALKYLQAEVDKLTRIVPFLVPTGVDLKAVRDSVRQLAKALGDDVKRAGSRPNTSKPTHDLVIDDVRAWGEANAVGVDKAVGRGAIEAGVLGDGAGRFKQSQYTKRMPQTGAVMTGEGGSAKWHWKAKRIGKKDK